MLENDRIRVIVTAIPIGANTPVPTHRWLSVERIIGLPASSAGTLDGKVLFDTRAANDEAHGYDVLWSDPFPPLTLTTSVTRSCA